MDFDAYVASDTTGIGTAPVLWYRDRRGPYWVAISYVDPLFGDTPRVRCVVDDFGDLQRVPA